MTRTVGTADGKTMTKYRRMLEKAGCTVKYDADAGTVVARDGEKVVMRGLKHPAGCWIARFFQSERVSWNW